MTRTAIVIKSFLMGVCLLASASSCGAKEPQRYGIKVLEEHAHDRGAYTQGLFFHNGSLYESTGLNGSSSIRKVDLQTGAAIQKVDFSRKYFAEGSVVLCDNLYVLTWNNKVVFIYDPTTLTY